jgi:hypothetical protein
MGAAATTGPERHLAEQPTVGGCIIPYADRTTLATAAN